ncbi:hypothetical protein FRB96_000797 [Tulasnella sp. 330]|nr:hypothetical protein FRB96_000797 [Tulasnella sp. 330]KAG8888848.1 hypothetical protein FRB98_006634 [Tulasnella sp. 332]
MSGVSPSNEVSLLDIPHPVMHLNNYVQKAGLVWMKDSNSFNERKGSGWSASICGMPISSGYDSPIHELSDCQLDLNSLVDGLEYRSVGSFKTKQAAFDSAARAALIALDVKIQAHKG